mgnify:CR=1 FL=1
MLFNKQIIYAEESVDSNLPIKISILKIFGFSIYKSKEYRVECNVDIAK